MFYRLLKPLLFRLEAERAHELVTGLLRLAAGIDKRAALVAPMALLGFGHIEVGTVTPRPQPGNDRPRLFRLPEDRALINRMGFNSPGMIAVAHNLRAYR